MKIIDPGKLFLDSNNGVTFLLICLLKKKPEIFISWYLHIHINIFVFICICVVENICLLFYRVNYEVQYLKYWTLEWTVENSSHCTFRFIAASKVSEKRYDEKCHLQYLYLTKSSIHNFSFWLSFFKWWKYMEWWKTHLNFSQKIQTTQSRWCNCQDY